MYFGGSFTYGDDFKSTDYNLEFAYKDTAEMVTPVSTKSYSILKNKANQKRYIYDSDYNEPLTFEAEIFVNGSAITEEKSREICRKLFNSNEFKWLKLDYPEWEGIHLNCYIVLNEKIYSYTSIGYSVVGYKITISCDAPFAWEDNDKFDLYLVNRVTSSEDSKDIVVDNPSDYERYTFPIMSVGCGAVSDNLDRIGFIDVEFRNGDDRNELLKQGYKIISETTTTSATISLQRNDGTTYNILTITYSKSGTTTNITKVRQESESFIKCKSLLLPDSIYGSKTITFGQYAFRESSSNSANTIGDITTEIVVPLSVSTIGTSAFRGYPYKTVNIPNSVKTIGNYAFQDSKLVSISFPNSITSFGTYCFKGNTDLVEVTLSNQILSIPTQAFYGCSSLESIIVPEGVTTISGSAFYNCSSLKSITLPKSLTSITSSAFYGCSSLKTVYYNGSQTDWSNISITSTNNSAIINAEKIYKE